MATTFAVPDGRVAMNVVLRNGFGTSGGSITSLLFKPDLVWEKPRNIVSDHELQDSVRGATKSLHSNTAGVEDTYPNYLTSFISNGYTFGTGDYATSVTAVDWCWKAGGTAVSNTAGTITSSVSANTTAGFSVVTYTGNGTGGATIGHGVQVGGVATAPSFIIVKNRSTTATDWECYQITLGNTYRIRLNRAFVADTGGALWANTTPTSTVFSVASDLDVNSSSETYVAYCWAPVAGYSAFGSYTGNGSADGPFIYTGFRPRFVMVKCSAAVESWYIFDSTRNAYNVADLGLVPNMAIAEFSSNTFDLVSNGIKIRTTNTLANSSATTYIYAAFAENPLKYANAR
jgi:hypothetical protein